jgi:tetratricopeptide (TPR) repeat protein
MRFPSRPLAALLLALATSAACAARPTAIQTPAATTSSTSAIDALIARGCFGCLTQAYDAAVAASNQTRAFEIALLLTARAKELGLPYTPWLERARAALPTEPGWPDYLAIVQALRIDSLADDRDAVLVETLKYRASAETVAAWRTALAAGAGLPLLRAYLELSLICQYVVSDRNVSIAATVQRFPDVPLIEYRAGACGSSQAPHLQAVRDAVPEFAEVDFLLGRYALDIPLQPDQEEALRRFTAARAAFPESPAIVGSLADLRRAREEWTEALEGYDATLTLVPTHRDALLGRAVTLSHLSRHDDAVAAATRLIDLGNWFTGEAYYWRAWNEYHLARIEDARIDTDRAKGLMHNASVLVLSGMIEWHDRRFDESEAELQDALTLDAGQCEAAVLLGAIRVERRQWASGAAAFELAQRCYDLSVTLRRETIARITAGPGTEEGKARQITRQQRAMAEDAQHRDEAAQNAANLQKRAGG